MWKLLHYIVWNSYLLIISSGHSIACAREDWHHFHDGPYHFCLYIVIVNWGPLLQTLRGGTKYNLVLCISGGLGSPMKGSPTYKDVGCISISGYSSRRPAQNVLLNKRQNLVLTQGLPWLMSNVIHTHAHMRTHTQMHTPPPHTHTHVHIPY